MTFHPASQCADTGTRLSAFAFVSKLSRKGKATLQDSVQPRHFPVGTEILQNGQLCQEQLLVERGEYRIFTRAVNGREITLYRVSPGEACLLGTVCVLHDTPYPASIVAAQPTDALAIPASVFRRACAREPAIQQYILGLFVSRIMHLMTLVHEVAFERMDERLARFLLQEATKMPGVYHPVVMSHDQLAAHLGTAREVISRLLEQFEHDGLIELERRLVRIREPEGLRKRLHSQAFRQDRKGRV